MKEYHGGGFEFHGIYESSLERLGKLAFEEEFVEDRDSWDYVYLQKDLATLSGRKFHGQKNHYNAFKKANPDYTFELINPENYAECLNFGEEWCRSRMDTDASIYWEWRALQEAFVNFEALGLRGGAIRIGGRIQAFSFGKAINDVICDENVEKANPQIRGLYTAIQKECAEKVWGDMTYINREEDMGNEGLRKAKEALHPAFMVKNTICGSSEGDAATMEFRLASAGDLPQVMGLWDYCFEKRKILFSVVFPRILPATQ